MSYWLADHELFLYAKGTGFDDVHLWRCKKPASSSSLIVPMKPDDFEYVSNVKNHQELIDGLFDWDEPDYKRLVEYIYEKRLLVNGQGFVIAEVLHKADKDENKTIDDANEEDVPAIYIRSLDVLPLKPYISDLMEQPIPLRTIKYLGDVNGKAATMKEDSNVTKLTARIADLESKNKTLEGENKTLGSKVTMLTAGQVAMTDKVDDLESKNKTLESKVTNLQQEMKNIKANNKDLVWMNDITNSEWVGVEGLKVRGPYEDLIITGSQGTFTEDDNTTNVRARYWYKIKPTALNSEFSAISLEDLTPHKERARFLQSRWDSFKSKGKTYVY